MKIHIPSHILRTTTIKGGWIMNNPLTCYFSTLKKYVVFSGRASRQEFWCYWVFQFLFIILTIGVFFPFFLIFLLLATILPSVAVTVRRLHDINRSGWWALPMITIIGIVIPFFFALQDGQTGANQYGINPKPGSSARTFWFALVKILRLPLFKRMLSFGFIRNTICWSQKPKVPPSRSSMELRV